MSSHTRDPKRQRVSNHRAFAVDRFSQTHSTAPTREETSMTNPCTIFLGRAHILGEFSDRQREKFWFACPIESSNTLRDTPTSGVQIGLPLRNLHLRRLRHLCTPLNRQKKIKIPPPPQHLLTQNEDPALAPNIEINATKCNAVGVWLEHNISARV